MADATKSVERWGRFEWSLNGPDGGNPFVEVRLGATFRHGNRQVQANGFYDGRGVYRLRFSPDAPGRWTATTHSNAEALDGQTTEFECTPAGPGNHGPVLVEGTHFVHADGTLHHSFGTTCYAWAHQGEQMAEQTLATLSESPFNKIRMCVFPKHHLFNFDEPPMYAYEVVREGTPGEGGDWEWDFHRFNPAFFRWFEQLVGRLCDLEVQADIILFHPYDRWGFANMPAEANDLYLRYVVARLAAYRNVWWSFANEFDLMKHLTTADWERFARIVCEHDPHQRLRSIHNCARMYDHHRPWITHCSIQTHEVHRVGQWLDEYRKPVVVDECGYEGDIHMGWGDLPPQEMTHRFWQAVAQGGYGGHSETYMHPQDELWWSKGGKLYGRSVERIAFLRQVLEGLPGPLECWYDSWGITRRGGPAAKYSLQYFDVHAPGSKDLEVPGDGRHHVDVIDAQAMTIQRLDGTYASGDRIPMPAKPYCALRTMLAD